MTVLGRRQTCRLLAELNEETTDEVRWYHSISGLNWVKTRVATTARPSVAVLDLGGGASTALDSAVSALVSSGVPVVVPAGNSASPVSNFSPARVPSAITVASSTIKDTFSSSSNYGPGVDIIAPATGPSSNIPTGTTQLVSLTCINWKVFLLIYAISRLHTLGDW
jgi:hypothetical protein